MHLRTRQVTRFTRVWIETLGESMAALVLPVTRFTRVWIETGKECSMGWFWKVTRFTRVWIETPSSALCVVENASHPLHAGVD